VAATVANGSQASKLSKVHLQVGGFDSEPGTRISEPYPYSESESMGDCLVLWMRKVHSYH
jgi:hypothetical protein